MTVLEFRRIRPTMPARVSRLLRRGGAEAAAESDRSDLAPATRTYSATPGRPQQGGGGTLPLRARLYVASVTLAAIVVAALVLPGVHWSRVNFVLFFALAALHGVIVLTGDFPQSAQSRSVAATVAVKLAAILLVPPPAAGAALALGTLLIFLRTDIPRLRMLFVVCMVFLTTNIGGAVYSALHGTHSMMQPEMPTALFPIFVASLVLSTMPSLFIAPIPVFSGRARLRAVAHDAIWHAIPRNVAYSFVGLIAAVLWRHHVQVLATLVILGPLLVTRWAAAQYAEQRAAHDATVRALVQAVEIKDLYTRGHSERVAKASEMIAQQLGMDEKRIGTLSYAAILHDVGKLGVPTRLLRKDGKFNAAELEAIRVHPVRGVDVVRDIAFLNEAYEAILHHHERMDGRGYPTGLAGERIPRFARIIAVADAFDSMTSTRSYRPARSVPDAMAELRACAGSQFDPVMVDAMETALHETEHAGRPWLGDGTMPDFVPPAAGDIIVQAADRTGAGNGTYDHDDPAFVVPSPLSDEQRDVARRGRL